ncbi:MAG: MbnP family protein [Saprospiraceae bacterium]
MKNNKEMVEKWKGLKVDLLLQPFNLSTFQLSSTLKYLTVSFLCIVIISSCYENRSGCLDLRATNFDIDADRECDNCCIYPQLKLVFEHKLLPDSAANLTYTTSVYKDGAGNEFRVKDIQFYVSNARLIRADGTVVAPQDSLLVSIQPPGGTATRQNIADNVAIINRSNFAAAEMGRFIATGSFTKIAFTLGLSDVLNQVIPTSLPDSLVNHPLENTAMYVNADTGFIFNRLQIFNSATATDTTFTTFRVLPPNLVNVELPLNANIIEGYHIRVIVRIDYLKWFANVNLKSDSPATVATKITNNLRNAFSVTRVEMEGL